MFSACNVPVCSRRVVYFEAEPDLMTPAHWSSRKTRSLNAACQRAMGRAAPVTRVHMQCGYGLVHVHVVNGPWSRIAVSDLGFMLVMYNEGNIFPRSRIFYKDLLQVNLPIDGLYGLYGFPSPHMKYFARPFAMPTQLPC